MVVRGNCPVRVSTVVGRAIGQSRRDVDVGPIEIRPVHELEALAIPRRLAEL